MRYHVQKNQPAGLYQVRWDARDQQSTALAVGRLHYPDG